jgi:hypothetical protein
LIFRVRHCFQSSVIERIWKSIKSAVSFIETLVSSWKEKITFLPKYSAFNGDGKT